MVGQASNIVKRVGTSVDSIIQNKLLTQLFISFFDRYNFVLEGKYPYSPLGRTMTKQMKLQWIMGGSLPWEVSHFE